MSGLFHRHCLVFVVVFKMPVNLAKTVYNVGLLVAKYGIMGWKVEAVLYEELQMSVLGPVAK